MKSDLYEKAQALLDVAKGMGLDVLGSNVSFRNWNGRQECRVEIVLSQETKKEKMLKELKQFNDAVKLTRRMGGTVSTDAISRTQIAVRDLDDDAPGVYA